MKIPSKTPWRRRLSKVVHKGTIHWLTPAPKIAHANISNLFTPGRFPMIPDAIFITQDTALQLIGTYETFFRSISNSKARLGKC